MVKVRKNYFFRKFCGKNLLIDYRLFAEETFADMGKKNAKTVKLSSANTFFP